ncbi:MAG: tetratricopeptide repeat protein [Candidatus Velthaea sp.]|jgi:tetratricopeptide (TPR) repeat protein
MVDHGALAQGLAAQRAGDLAAAERAYRSVLAGDPADVDARNLLATIAFARRDFDEAERLLRAVLADEPGNAPALFNLARVDETLERYDDALAHYTAIPAHSPQFVEALMRIGTLHYRLWSLDAAALAFAAVLEAVPRHPLAGLNLGVVHNQQGRHHEAIRVLQAMLVVHPGLDDLRRPLADSLRSIGELDEAHTIAREVLARNPHDEQMLIVYGRTLYDSGQIAQAEAAFRAATQLAPDFPDGWTNVNVVNQHLHRLDTAIFAGERAIERAPEDAEAHLNLAMSYLMAGDFARGWPFFEWRLRGHKNRGAHPYRGRLPQWDGTPMPGKRLLISRDEGVGDLLLHARFFGEVKRRSGALVTLECPPELESLLAHAGGIDTILPGRCDPARAAQFDAHVPLGSIAFALGVDDAFLRGIAVPYLRADPERIERFRARLAALPGRRKIGIVWAGSPGHGSDRYRSCGLAAFSALADLADIAWVSLQKGPAEEQLASAPGGMVIEALGPELHDYADTAGAVAALDLVISVDTSVVHLAGALGAPVWTLLGFESYWLWRTGRTDSPWYPSMRLFRQRETGRWNGVFEDVHAALRAEIGAASDG